MRLRPAYESNLAFWFRAVLVDSILAGFMVAAFSLGLPGAEMSLQFWLWVLTVFSLLVAVSGDKTLFSDRPFGFGYYHAGTEFFFLSVLVWHGYVALPVVRIIALVGFESARKREPK